MGDSINQDDIDKLLQESMGGGAAPAPKAAPAPAPAPAAAADLDGQASQDDIDALFASVGADPAPAPGNTPVPAPPAPPPADPVFEGIANQDDIDALFAAADAADPVRTKTTIRHKPASEPAPAPAAPAPAPEPEFEGVANQDDIDALFSAVGGGTGTGTSTDHTGAGAAAAPAAAAPEPAAAPAEEEITGVANQDDIDALFSGIAAEPDPAAASVGSALVGQNDIDQLVSGNLDGADDDAASAAETDAFNADALLSSIADGAGEAAVPAPAPAAPTAAADDDDDFDMDALLREVEAAVPPPPPERPPDPQAAQAADTVILDMPRASAHVAPAPTPAPAPVAAPMPDMPASLPQFPPAALVAAAAGPRREYSVLYGAGEVDSVASQINALLNSMSEKAHSYMQAWIAADSEAKELRARALAEERRRSSLESEKHAIGGQLDELRAKVAELEGGKIASAESRRTLETTFQSKIRELESHVKLLTSESEALKDELTRARNEATGVDIESRRARFEADRLKNEIESERMERLRIQRALENREKELQATQAQASGQASSLFIDELHRLVRRLESELDARASGAHEALKQLDRMEMPESMVPVAANLRAALMQALGRDAEANDALKSLGREAGSVKGAAAVAPEKTELVSFETALATYNLSGSVDIAGALLREARATSALLMKKIYQAPALRRPEVVDHLPALARLLEGLRTVQEANDHARGSESGESELFYVHLFDFLHNLVKLKLINRMSGDMWRIFLDLRGRFSFVNSDRQWAEYRDRTLGGE